jgi:hypothetical protein
MAGATTLFRDEGINAQVISSSQNASLIVTRKVTGISRSKRLNNGSVYQLAAPQPSAHMSAALPNTVA